MWWGVVFLCVTCVWMWLCMVVCGGRNKITSSFWLVIFRPVPIAPAISRHDDASRLWRDFGVRVVLAYLPGSLVKLCQSQYRLKKHKMQVGEARWPHVPYNIELEITKKYSAVFKHRRPWSLVGWGQEKGKKCPIEQFLVLVHYWKLSAVGRG